MTASEGEDPENLVIASREGNARRAIDIHEGEEVDTSTIEPKRPK